MITISIEKISNGFLVHTDYNYDVTTQDGKLLGHSKEFAGNADAIRDCLARVGIKLQHVDWTTDAAY
ncbi:MAG: hypothetical protein B7X60_00135 [Polynucleobacter sp. 39-45-136]|jgi:hypothetical protein|nr:MAG: hypothetical protein B7X60_00135 [Polynucleobacter sp. 39-45-136]